MSAKEPVSVEGRGAKSKLNDEQRKKLREMLQRGAEAYGYPSDRWTHTRIAQLIHDEFGISYHPKYIFRIRVKLGWKPQKPLKYAKPNREDTRQGQKEARWIRGWELFQSGWKQDAIAEDLGVSESAVSRWVKKGKAGGIEALRAKPGQGAKSKLNDEQRKRLLEMLQRGAKSYGFCSDIWTYSRVAEVIRRKFGISYSHAHAGRILVEQGWKRQEPGSAKQREDQEEG